MSVYPKLMTQTVSVLPYRRVLPQLPRGLQATSKTVIVMGLR